MASTLSAGCSGVEGKKRDRVVVGLGEAAAAAVLLTFYVLISLFKLNVFRNVDYLYSEAKSRDKKLVDCPVCHRLNRFSSFVHFGVSEIGR